MKCRNFGMRNVVAASVFLLGSYLSVRADSASNSFDGQYVAATGTGASLSQLSTGPNCPDVSRNLGWGLTVKNSTGLFDLGVQPTTAKKIKPLKVSGKVTSNGTFSAQKGQVRVSGGFNGPAKDGTDFHGELVLTTGKATCGYVLLLHYTKVSTP
jgi:hypothetical protein